VLDCAESNKRGNQYLPNINCVVIYIFSDYHNDSDDRMTLLYPKVLEVAEVVGYLEYVQWGQENHVGQLFGCYQFRPKQKKPGLSYESGLFWLSAMLAVLYKRRLFVARTLCNRFHYTVQVEAAGLLPWWKFAKAL
jgi:hypothetical protein